MAERGPLASEPNASGARHLPPNSAVDSFAISYGTDLATGVFIWLASRLSSGMVSGLTSGLASGLASSLASGLAAG
jgi:hypothetical protein